MRLKLILHVGVHKTGTTAIQSFLAENKQQLKKHGIYFPDKHCTIENKPVILRDAIFNDDKNRYEKIIQDIIRSAEKENCTTVVLSDEDFQMFAHKANNNISILKQYFDVNVVMYLRRQDRYSESAYGFWVQWYNKRTTVEPRNLLKLFPMINYDYLLKRWENLFGIEKIRVRIYDRIAKQGNLIPNFMEILDIQNLSGWEMPSKDKSNITLNKYILEFLRRTNHIPLLQNEFQLLKEYLATESIIQKGPKPIFLDKGQRIALLEKANASNVLVASRYFDENELFPDDLPDDVSESLSEEKFREVINNIENVDRLKEFVRRDIADLNIEKMRDIIINERKKQGNKQLSDFLTG